MTTNIRGTTSPTRSPDLTLKVRSDGQMIWSCSGMTQELNARSLLSKMGFPAMFPATFQLWPMRMSAISLYLYGVKDIPQQNWEIEESFFTHHPCSHIYPTFWHPQHTVATTDSDSSGTPHRRMILCGWPIGALQPSKRATCRLIDHGVEIVWTGS